MTREELEKQVIELIEKWSHSEDFLFCEDFIKDAVKLGIRYGFEKGRLFDYADEGTCSYKYESVEEVLAELDKEQDDKR